MIHEPFLLLSVLLLVFLRFVSAVEINKIPIMDKEILIECVKEYPILYDIHHKLYGNADKKNMTWKEISRKVRAPALVTALFCITKKYTNDDKDTRSNTILYGRKYCSSCLSHPRECKKTWTLLRDAFRRYVKKQKELGNDTKNGIINKWKYADEMAYLLPYFRHRRSKVLTDEDDDFAYNNESMGEETSMSFVGMENEKIFTETSAEFTQDELITRPTKGQRMSSCEQLSIPEEKTAFATLLQYIVDDKKNTDDIQHFFTGITATVRNFPPEDKIIAKAKVFELITTMELDILSRKDKGYDVSDHDVKSDEERH